MAENDFCVINSEPNTIKLTEGKGISAVSFGEVIELTSVELGARLVSVAEVRLWGPDFPHYHKKTEETYICREGEGKLFLANGTIDFLPGTRVIIKPGTIHAAKPLGRYLVFTCVSAPAFNPEDEFRDERGRKW